MTTGWDRDRDSTCPAPTQILPGAWGKPNEQTKSNAVSVMRLLARQNWNITKGKSSTPAQTDASSLKSYAGYPGCPVRLIKVISEKTSG